MGRSSISALTLPRCQRLSSSTRCFTATWAPTCRCCILQPPHAPACRPKCGQPGRTRCDDSRWMATRLACSQLFFLRWVLAVTTSDGRAPSMKTTLPSGLRATPWASRSRDCTSNCPSGKASWDCSEGSKEGESSVGSLIPRLSQARPPPEPAARKDRSAPGARAPRGARRGAGLGLLGQLVDLQLTPLGIKRKNQLAARCHARQGFVQRARKIHGWLHRAVDDLLFGAIDDIAGGQGRLAEKARQHGGSGVTKCAHGSSPSLDGWFATHYADAAPHFTAAIAWCVSPLPSRRRGGSRAHLAIATARHRQTLGRHSCRRCWFFAGSRSHPPPCGLPCSRSAAAPSPL